MSSGKGLVFSDDFLMLIFNATPIGTIADNTGTSPLTNLYLALHTADPTASGNQSTNEVVYTGYARASVARTSAGFTVTGATVALAADVAFPSCTAGSSVASYFSVGTAASGAGKILYYGPLVTRIQITSSVVPTLTTDLQITEG